MSEKTIGLAKEAKELITEFKVEESILGINTLESINISSNGKEITIVDEYDGEITYGLEEVSAYLKLSMEGHGPCPAGFYDAMNIAISDLDTDFKNMKKEEFIQHAGKLKYVELRCEQIYKRLKEIETEVE